MRRNLFAYTVPGSNYPEYISINKEDDGLVSVTVRSAVKLEGACGETSVIYLPAHVASDLLGEV